VARDHQVRHLQDAPVAGLERGLVIGIGVDMRRSVGSPPGWVQTTTPSIADESRVQEVESGWHRGESERSAALAPTLQ
jgi:hypothetical protein